MRWRVVCPPLVWRSWGDGDAVVYHPASGDTHHVNPVTAEVLRRLERAAVGPAELAVHVAAELGSVVDAEWEHQIVDLLGYLDGLGLVERVR